jgi:ATP-dependent Clp protease adaptor protein ClpS
MRSAGISARMISTMTTKTANERRIRTRNRTRSELPWNVILHNDWENSMPRVVIALKKVIPGMTYRRAARIMYEAHSTGRAVVKSCHRELAEFYEERLLSKGLTASVEPAR